MPSAHHLLTFLAAAVTFAVVPGPALLYAASQTVARGRRAGLLAALGVHCGGYVQVLAVTLGLAALLRYVPPLYLAVKLAGAAYLVWLGIGMIRSAARKAAPQAAAAAGGRAAFLQSVTVEVLNPKSALFYLAFLPQFAEPAAALPVWVQTLGYGIVANILFSVADVIVTLCAGAIMRRAGRSGIVTHVARLLGGSVLIGLGARLAAAK